MFSSGSRHWAWTPQGLEQWTDRSEPPAVEVAATPPATAPQSIRVMSYNVLYGAGATPYWEEIAATQPGFKYPGNRLPAVLEVIKGAEPDIVGIQEAAGWNSSEPLIIEQVAAELGMNQFLALTPSGLNLALLTKFEIVETENLSDDVGNIGALRATLAIDRSGQQVHVFVVHLDPFSAATRAAQIGRLTQAMEPYRQAPTILMGDTNVECVNRPEQCQEYQLLSQAGWQLVVKERYLINQIWSSPLLAGSASEIAFPGVDFSMSDHLPVGVVFETPRSSPQ
jgi:endonuclease/exonuclease/phosphatase family metal-dependent hydrolase